MNRPRGRPFLPGNKMGHGRPKGSRNKINNAVRKLLEQSELPVIGQCIRQALQGHHNSQRLVLELYQNLPRPRSKPSRLGKIESLEDLRGATLEIFHQTMCGDITTEEAKTALAFVEQMAQLKQQSTLEKQSHREPKTELPEFMQSALEEAHKKRMERREKAAAEKLASNTDE